MLQIVKRTQLLITTGESMHGIPRRQLVQGLGLALTALAYPAAAQNKKPTLLAPKLRIVIPAATRSNLDEAGRGLGDALLGLGLCDETEYENIDAKNGTQALATYLSKYNNDANTLFIGDTSLVGAAALYKSAGVERLAPIARVTNDYLIVAVAAGSPLKTIAQLGERLRAAAGQTALAVSALGSVDQIFAGLLLKAAGAKPEDGAYTAISRRHELVDAVVSGKAAAGISGHATFAADIASGKLRALGVSSKRTMHGIPAVREQGLDVDITNWRTVFTGQGVPAARQAEMVEAVKKAVTYELWKKNLKQNYWDSSWLAGADLASFIDIDSKTLQVIMQLLKFKP
jgi:putative tricarboxylic transport membrane protein